MNRIACVPLFSALSLLGFATGCASAAQDDAATDTNVVANSAEPSADVQSRATALRGGVCGAPGWQVCTGCAAPWTGTYMTAATPLGSASCTQACNACASPANYQISNLNFFGAYGTLEVCVCTNPQ